MPNIIIARRSRDLAAWQGAPLSEEEIRECFAKHIPAPRPETSRLVGQTAAGRKLIVSYKYAPGSDEIKVLSVEDGLPSRDKVAELADWEANYDKRR